MANAEFNPAVTETVVVSPSHVTLTLTPREAMLIDMYVSYTRTATSPEAESILMALSKVCNEIGDYSDEMHLTTSPGMYGPILEINDGPNPN